MNSLVPFPKSRKQQCRLLAHRIDVRFGSKADMCGATAHVRFVPKADMALFIRTTRLHARREVAGP